MDIHTILSSKEHNPHYLNRYIKFINYCQNQIIDESILINLHHICPKAKDMFPEYKSFNQNPWNKIKLTFEQHITAHHILALTFNTRSMNSAYIYMLKNSKNTKETRIKSKHISSKLSEQMKIDNPSHNPETIAKSVATFKANWTEADSLACSHRRLGRCDITEDGLRRISEFWKGKSRPKTDAHIRSHKLAIQKFEYITPFGTFISSTEASIACGISTSGIIDRCKNNLTIINKYNTRTKTDKTDKSFIGKTWKDLGYELKSIVISNVGNS